MSRVALLRCGSYDVDLIEKTLREGFELLGGEQYLKRILGKDKKILLKPNLLSVEAPGSPVVTHYAVFEAVIRIIRDYSRFIAYGDSPGFGDGRKAAEKCGLQQVAEKYGVEFADFREAIHVKYEEGLLCKSWEIAKPAYEAEVVITLPKIKTHAMAYYSGAIKNQFGCVPGTRKAAWHTRMPEASNFSKMLLDLNGVVGTSFAILDGIIAMEGNGPKNGTPKQMNTLIMGEDICAVDSTAVRLIGYEDPIFVPVLKEAHLAKIGDVLPQEIEVLGETIEDMECKDFVLSRRADNFNFINPKVNRLLRAMIAPKPVVIADKCVSCGRCLEVCPEKPHIITLVDKKGKKLPQWDLKKCIRCFCCQELCPVGAIDTVDTTAAKLLRINKR